MTNGIYTILPKLTLIFGIGAIIWLGILVNIFEDGAAKMLFVSQSLRVMAYIGNFVFNGFLLVVLGACLFGIVEENKAPAK